MRLVEKRQIPNFEVYINGKKVKFNFEPKKLNKEKNLQTHLTNFENKILASSKLEYRVKEHKRKWSHECVGADSIGVFLGT